MPIKLIITIIVGVAILSIIFLVFFPRIYSGASQFKEAESEDVGAISINECKLLCETFEASGLTCTSTSPFCANDCDSIVNCDVCEIDGTTVCLTS